MTNFKVGDRVRLTKRAIKTFGPTGSFEHRIVTVEAIVESSQNKAYNSIHTSKPLLTNRTQSGTIISEDHLQLAEDVPAIIFEL